MVQCCGGQGEENQQSPDQDMSGGWHPLGAPQDLNTVTARGTHSANGFKQTITAALLRSC